jgi:AmpD protein
MISTGARFVQSPNRSSRKRADGADENKTESGAWVECVVIHHISLPPGRFGTGDVEAFFLNRLDYSSHPYYDELRGLRVSAHYFIDRDGALTQFVDTIDAAWHAGQSAWRGREAVNDFSIGIELEGDEATPYTEAQYLALAGLLKEIKRAYPRIAAADLTGHEDVAPGRKHDPGAHFNWDRVRKDFVLNC